MPKAPKYTYNKMLLNSLLYSLEHQFIDNSHFCVALEKFKKGDISDLIKYLKPEELRFAEVRIEGKGVDESKRFILKK